MGFNKVVSYGGELSYNELKNLQFSRFLPQNFEFQDFAGTIRKIKNVTRIVTKVEQLVRRRIEPLEVFSFLRYFLMDNVAIVSSSELTRQLEIRERWRKHSVNFFSNITGTEQTNVIKNTDLMSNFTHIPSDRRSGCISLSYTNSTED